MRILLGPFAGHWTAGTLPALFRRPSFPRSVSHCIPRPCTELGLFRNRRGAGQKTGGLRLLDAPLTRLASAPAKGLSQSE